MVWGMALPSGFGQFWPSGEFEYDRKTRDTGWYARLRAYYAQQTPEEQRRLFDYTRDPNDATRLYGTYPVSKFTNEPGWSREGEGKPPLDDVEPHEVPRSFDLDKTYKSLASLIKLNDKLVAVDETLKAIIERFEPSVHEFYPFALNMPREKTYPSQYYILRICQYFDAFSRDETWEGSFDESTSNPGLLFLNKTKDALNGLAMDRTIFGNAHVWRDRTFREELTCFSDALMAEIKQAGLRLPKHFKLKDV